MDGFSPFKLDSKKSYKDRDFYASDFWKNLSKSCKRRDSNTCQFCKKKARTKEERRKLHADHIISRSKGGLDILTNLRTLCETCHASLHPHMQKAIATREAAKNKPTFTRPNRIKKSYGNFEKRKF